MAYWTYLLSLIFGSCYGDILSRQINTSIRMILSTVSIQRQAAAAACPVNTAIAIRISTVASHKIDMDDGH